MEMTSRECDLHIVMFPWSAFGHMIPFYQLSIALAKKGVHVSYATTSKNIERLPKIPPNLSPLMQYVSLPITPVPGLPQGAEATVDVEFDQIQYLKAAYDFLHEPFKQFVKNCSPNWIISDFVAYWMPELAQECKVKLMYFAVYTATGLAFIGPPEYLMGDDQQKIRPRPEIYTSQPEWASIYPPSVALRGYEAARFFTVLFGKSTSGVRDGERMAKLVQGCQAVCVRTCREFEGDYIDLYQSLTHKPVVPVGLLPPAQASEGEESRIGPWTETFKWLDRQSSRSVIYVGFGSEYKLTKDEVYEMAYGLELAQLPFIWALRKPTWAVDDSEALPPGFLTRTSGKGFVHLGWAPQLEILAHPSIGGSLFHSGWGSIIEALQHGHNLIVLPFIVDQGLNARMIVDKGLGIEVERRDDGSYTRDDIGCALRRAMLGDEAQRISARAKQAAAVFGDQKLHEEHYMGQFVEYSRQEDQVRPKRNHLSQLQLSKLPLDDDLPGYGRAF